MLHERSQTQKAACCMIPLILHFRKVKIIGKENKSVFARDWGKGLITKGSVGIWGGGW